MPKFLTVINGYAKRLKEETNTPVIISPAEVKSERFHIELSLIPHPVVFENGRVRFRLRGTVFAEIPASNLAIDDCLKKSIALAQFFCDTQNFDIDKQNENYGLAFHKPLREDDDLFSDLASEQRSYSYNESWLIELEFDLEKNK